MAVLTAFAKSTPLEIGSVWFKSDGKSMDNDFQKQLTDANVETALIKRMREMQPGDVVETYADCTRLMKDFGYMPETDIRTGLRRFIDWYRETDYR